MKEDYLDIDPYNEENWEEENILSIHPGKPTYFKKFVIPIKHNMSKEEIEKYIDDLIGMYKKS